MQRKLLGQIAALGKMVLDSNNNISSISLQFLVGNLSIMVCHIPKMMHTKTSWHLKDNKSIRVGNKGSISHS